MVRDSESEVSQIWLETFFIRTWLGNHVLWQFPKISPISPDSTTAL